MHTVLWLLACSSAPPEPPPPETAPIACAPDGLDGVVPLDRTRSRNTWSDGKGHAVVWDGPYGHRLATTGDGPCWHTLPPLRAPIVMARDDGEAVTALTSGGVMRLPTGAAQWTALEGAARGTLVSRRRPGEQTWLFDEGRAYRWEGGDRFGELALPEGVDRLSTFHQQGDGPLWVGAGSTLHHWHEGRWTARPLRGTLRDLWHHGDHLYALVWHDTYAEVLRVAGDDVTVLLELPYGSWSGWVPWTRADGAPQLFAVGREGDTTLAVDVLGGTIDQWVSDGANTVGRARMIATDGDLLVLLTGQSLRSSDDGLVMWTPDAAPKPPDRIPLAAPAPYAHDASPKR